jgi:hypothetical protein
MRSSAVVRVAESFEDQARPAIKLLFGVDTLNRKRVYDAFYREYNAFIVHELSKRNTFTANLEDLTGNIWKDFSGSASGIGLIEKFFSQVSSSPPTLPETLTGEEVARFLSVSFPSWVGAWARRNIQQVKRKVAIPELPSPVSGSYLERQAVYLSADIEAWYEEFECVRHILLPEGSSEWLLQLPMPVPTKRYFINYLKTSINNRWANFCRYESRRHQERVWDTFSECRSKLPEGDAPPWEDRLESASSQEVDTEVALLVNKLCKVLDPIHVQPIMMAMFDDHLSLRDAIERAETLSSEQKRRVIQSVCDAPTRSAAA